MYFTRQKIKFQYKSSLHCKMLKISGQDSQNIDQVQMENKLSCSKCQSYITSYIASSKVLKQFCVTAVRWNNKQAKIQRSIIYLYPVLQQNCTSLICVKSVFTTTRKCLKSN
ncbi:Hypothetical_protein [Hexamita inflata]|uniref:Hypothetical_protein n=1 Tax=Hexamita inflata TaxID=28002 RepID=A0AA86P664_9EUKA|nr:Hypothetical protein HINF_LOCUS20607 [Hexamita inflata]